MRVAAAVLMYPPHSRVGAWIATHELLADLVAAGHQVDVMTTMSSRPRYTLDGVSVSPMRRGRDLDNLVRASDVVISHLGDNGVAHRMAVSAGVPSVRMVHGPRPDPAAMAGASLVVFNAAWSAAAAPAPCSSIVVHPPVRPARYRTTPGSAVTLVNLSKPKGVLTAWRAAEQLPDVEFLGVVGGYGEQIRPRLANWTTIGTQTDMRPVYGRTRILLVPSAEESWGRVAVEAMCSGIPVIAHPTAGLQECLGSAGVFVDRDDISGWVTAIRRLLDPAEWAIWSGRAKARADELDPTEDLDLFRRSLEALTTQGAHA